MSRVKNLALFYDTQMSLVKDRRKSHSVTKIDRVRECVLILTSEGWLVLWKAHV